MLQAREQQLPDLGEELLHKLRTQVRQYDHQRECLDPMRLPLHNHFHFHQPGLDELVEREASLNQLTLQDAQDEIVWLDDHHSVEVCDELLEERIAVRQGYHRSRLDQVYRALNQQSFLLLQCSINLRC